MERLVTKSLAFFVLLCIPSILLGQLHWNQSATIGKEFYVAFGENTTTTTLLLKIKVISKKDTYVNVFYGDGTAHSGNPFFVGANQTKDIALEYLKVVPNIKSTPWKEAKGVRVESTEEIMLYALNQGKVSAEATAVLQIESLGKEYIGISYPSSGSNILSLVSTEDGTNVSTASGFNGQLDKTWVGNTAVSLYGEITNISTSADKRVAAFASSKEIWIPKTVGTGDNLFEQLWPLKSWGKSYIVPVTHRKKELIRVLAKEAGTDVKFTGGGFAPFTRTLSNGEFIDTIISNVVQIEANKPVAVNSFMLGNEYPGLDANGIEAKYGDPSQCWINPNEQMTAYALVSPFDLTSAESEIDQHRLLVVTREKYKKFTKLILNGIDNSSLIQSKFQSFPGIPDYWVAEIEMQNWPNQVYEIENPYGFNAYVYGYGKTESYHFAAGSMVWDLKNYFLVDTIYHYGTSEITNTYSTSGRASIYRNIEQNPYTSVEWIIKGTPVNNSYINDPGQPNINYHWYLPTAVDGDPYGLELGENTIQMKVCDGSNCETYTSKIWITPAPKANEDLDWVFGNTGGIPDTAVVKITENDDYLKPSDEIEIKVPPKHGSAEIKDTTLKYVPNPGFTGIDTIIYCVQNEFDTTCTQVYILVPLPESENYVACPGTKLTLGLKPMKDVTFSWYRNTGLPPIASSTNQITTEVIPPEIITVIPTYTGPTTLDFSTIKIPIKVNLSKSCSEDSETTCVGSTLFFEDFGGNNPSDPDFSTTKLNPLYQIPISYAFQQNELNAPKQYSLAKNIDSHSFGDHTFASVDSGRMLLVHGSTSIDTLMRVPVGGLCGKMKYSFSFWFSDISGDKPEFELILKDTIKNAIKYKFSTGPIKNNKAWKQYGFELIPTIDLNDIQLIVIYKPGNITSGNKFAIDDIKISLCIPKATANVDNGSICTRTNATFTGAFLGTGSDLGGTPAYQWQFNGTSDVNDNAKWTNITGATSTTYNLIKAKKAQQGHYRFVAGSASALSGSTISKPNCVVYSDPVYLEVIPCFGLVNDTVTIKKGTSINIVVTDNDTIPDDFYTTSVKTIAKNGTASKIDNDHIQYIPNNGFVGVDSVEYKVESDGKTKEAWIHILVWATEKDAYEACPGVNIELGMIPITDVTFDWYDASLSAVTGGTQTNKIIVEMPGSSTSYYVQAYYKGRALGSKIEVPLSRGSDCGSDVDKSCRGNSVFFDDFGGNFTTDTEIGSAIGAEKDYQFISDKNNIGIGKYSIIKLSSDNVDDHTYNGIDNRGYFLQVHTDNSHDVIYEKTIDIELCNDVDFSVNAWLQNLGGANKPNVRILVKDNLNNILANHQTGNITNGTPNETWLQYSTSFNVAQTVTKITVSIINNLSVGESILGIDDIDLKICSVAGVKITNTDASVCEGSDFYFIVDADENELKTLFGNNLVYKWQKSETGNINNPSDWRDTASIRDFKITNIQPEDVAFYRLIVGNASLMNRPSCYMGSTPIELVVKPAPVITYTGDTVSCSATSTIITASGASKYEWTHSGETTASIEFHPTKPIEFLKLKVTADNGCEYWDGVNVIAVSDIKVTKSADTAICLGKSVELYAHAEGYGINYSWPATGEKKSKIVVSPTTSTYYTVLVSNANGCTPVEEKIYVEVIQLPSTNISGPTDVCEGQEVKLTASGNYSFNWNNGKTDPSIFVTPIISPTEYSVTATDAKGCSSTVTHPLNIKTGGAPNPQVAFTKSEICAGESVQLTASGGDSYKWIHNLSPSSIINVSPNVTTDYKVEVATANGCKANGVVTITVNPLPNIGLVADTTVCAGSTLVLEAESLSPQSGLSYTWSSSSGSGSILDKVITANENVWVEVKTHKGCLIKKETKITALPQPSLTIAGVVNDSIKVCKGSELDLQVFGAQTYLWSNGLSGNKLNDFPIYDKLYTVIGKDNNGCEAKKVVNVVVNPLPVPKITGDLGVCEGGTTILTPSGGKTYVWKHDPSFALGAIPVSPITTTDYTVTVIDSLNCKADKTISVKVNSLPQVSMVADTAICAGVPLQLETKSTESGLTYLWSTGKKTKTIEVITDTNKIVSVTITNPANCKVEKEVEIKALPSPVLDIIGPDYVCKGSDLELQVIGASTYVWSDGTLGDKLSDIPTIGKNYRVTGTDEKGCKTTIQHPITIKSLPLPVITGKLEICKGDTTILTPSGGIDYMWKHNPLSNLVSMSVNPLTSTKYSVIAIDANQCSAETSVTVKVNSLPVVDLVSDISVCAGMPLTLTTQSSDPGLTYLWSNGGKSKTTEIVTDTNKLVTVAVTNPNKCVTNKEVAITALPAPVLTVMSPIDSVCRGSELNIQIVGANTYKWGDGTVGDLFTDYPMENKNYTVTGTDANNCTSSIHIPIGIKSLPIPDIKGITEICYGDTTRLSPIGGMSYVWKHNPTSTDVNIEVIPVETTNYTVTATGFNGCKADKTVSVKVNSLPQVTWVSDTTVCSGTLLALDVKSLDLDLNYLWENGNVSNAVQMIIPKDTILKTWVEIKTLKQCAIKKEVTIKALPSPKLIVSGIKDVCKGSELNLQAFGATNYEWSNGVIGSKLIDNPTHDKVYSVIGSNDLGCKATTLVNVKILPLPEPIVTGNSISCNNPVAALNVNVPGDPGAKYYWYHSGQDTGDISYVPDLNNEVKVRVTGSNQCSIDELVKIQYTSTLDLTKSSDTLICRGSEIELHANSIGKDVDYLWSTGQTGKKIHVKPDKSQSYDIKAYNAQGCESKQSIYVEVFKLPDYTLTSDTAICKGSEIVLQAQTPESGREYLWSTGATTDKIKEAPTENKEYYVTVSNAKCSVKDTVKVTVYDLPYIVILGKDEICQNEKVELKAYGGLSYIWNTESTNQSIVVDPQVNSTYRVRGTDVNGCYADADFEVKIKSGGIPKPKIAGKLEICAGDTTKLTPSGGLTYEWKHNPASSETAINVGPIVDTKYTVTAIGANGCKAEETVNVVVHQIPKIGMPSDTMVCAGTPIVLRALSPNVGLNYLWSNNSITEAIEVVPEDDEKYWVQITDLNKCKNKQEITVTTLPAPIMEIYGPREICKGSELVLNAIGADFYKWNDGSNYDTIVSHPIKDRVYRVTGTNSLGCTTSLEVDVKVKPLPIPTFTGNFVTCDNPEATISVSGGSKYYWYHSGEKLSSITYTPTSDRELKVEVTGDNNCSINQIIPLVFTGELTLTKTVDTAICKGSRIELQAHSPNDNVSYLWNTGEKTNIIPVQPDQSQFYTIKATSPQNCVTEEKIYVEVVDLPQAKIEGKSDICLGEEVELKAFGGETYKWNIGNEEEIIHVIPKIPTKYSVTATNYRGCSTTVDFMVNFKPGGIPMPVISGLLDVCKGDSTTLTASGGDYFIWKNNNSQLKAITVAPQIPTEYIVEAFNNNGCKVEKSVNVGVKPLPEDVDITGKFTLCEGEETILTASGGVKYIWDHNPLSSETTKVIPVTDTSYTVRVFGDNGCSIKKTANIEVNIPPQFSLSPDTIICLGSTVKLQTQTSEMGLNYLWSNGSKSRLIEFKPDSSQTIWVEVSDLKKCTKRKEVSITTLAGPTLEIYGHREICKGEELNLYAMGAQSYVWNDGTKSDQFIAHPAVNRTYYVTGTDEFGCKTTSQVDVTVNKMSEYKISIDPMKISAKSPEVNFNAQLKNNFNEIFWDFGDGNVSTMPSFTHYYQIGDLDREYKVAFYITDEKGCRDTVYKTIDVDIFVPNTISPNGDGINDLFMGECSMCKTIKIFDRLGNLLYEGNKGWDGRYKGKIVQDDTYFYVIILDTEKDEKIRKGYITVRNKK